MGTFQDFWANSFKNILLSTSNGGESVTYTPAGGSASTINAIISNWSVDYQENQNGTDQIITCNAQLSVLDVASPAVADSMVIRTVTFQVGQIIKKDTFNNTALLALVSKSGIEKSQQDYRR
jgi:hypothetical protein